MSTKKKKAVSVWSDPSEMINSGYGRINMKTWCEKECARINADGVRVAVEKKDGLIAICKV